MTPVPTDYEKAMLDPTSVFHHPAEIVARRDFSQRQKIEVLRSWEYDTRELDVAEEENMGGGESGELLDQILEALRLLGAHPVEGSPAPTKHGGA